MFIGQSRSTIFNMSQSLKNGLSMWRWRKNDKNDIRRGKVKSFGEKAFSGERFRIKGLFYTSYKMAISVQNPMLEVNY